MNHRSGRENRWQATLIYGIMASKVMQEDET